MAKWIVDRRPLPDLDDRTPLPRGLTEAELLYGYRGLIDRRQARRPDPILTVETVRAHHEAALDEDDAARPDSREEVRP